LFVQATATILNRLLQLQQRSVRTTIGTAAAATTKPGGVQQHKRLAPVYAGSQGCSHFKGSYKSISSSSIREFSRNSDSSTASRDASVKSSGTQAASHLAQQQWQQQQQQHCAVSLANRKSSSNPQQGVGRLVTQVASSAADMP
jgi:hypothetical protein